MTDVDATYLAWRYRDCPELAYGAADMFDRTSRALAVIRRTMRQGLSELPLCDLFAAGYGSPTLWFFACAWQQADARRAPSERKQRAPSNRSSVGLGRLDRRHGGVLMLMVPVRA